MVATNNIIWVQRSNCFHGITACTLKLPRNHCNTPGGYI